MRLGIEEAKASISEMLDDDQVEETIVDLRAFEEDANAYGLYTRSLALIAQTSKE